MRIDEIDILTLIPQRRPFVFIDKLTHIADTEASTEYTIKEDCMLLSNGVYQEAGIMESIAQTCAAYLGYLNKTHRERIGVIGAVKDLSVNTLPKVGDNITTSIKVINEIFGITLVEAIVMKDDEILAQCEMKLVLTEKEIES